MRTAAELGETLLHGLATGNARAIEDLLSETIEFHQAPLPRVRGKKRVMQVVGLLTQRARWSLIEKHAVLADEKLFVCERTESLIALGLDLRIRATMVLACKAGKIERITDYVDLLHCIGAFFKALWCKARHIVKV